MLLTNSGWLAGWLSGWLSGWLIGWLAGWLAGWLETAGSGRTAKQPADGSRRFPGASSEVSRKPRGHSCVVQGDLPPPSARGIIDIYLLPGVKN